MARTIGKGMRELQRAKDELKKNIEFEVETVSQVKSDFREMINETEEEIKSEFKSPPPETKDQDNLS